MRYLKWGTFVLAGTLLLITAFIFGLVCATFDKSNWHIFSLLGVTLVLFIGFISAQLFAFRGLLSLEVARRQREKGLAHQIKATEHAVDSLKNSLVGEQKVVSERIAQIRQSLEDLKA